jgi:hypothetical protein
VIHRMDGLQILIGIRHEDIFVSGNLKTRLKKDDPAALLATYRIMWQQAVYERRLSEP